MIVTKSVTRELVWQTSENPLQAKSENTPGTQFRDQSKSLQPLEERQLDLQLLTQRGREAELGDALHLER